MPRAIALIALLSTAFLVGLNLPIGKPHTYQLVMNSEGEESIVDHDMSVTDCGFALQPMARIGLDVTCRPEAR